MKALISAALFFIPLFPFAAAVCAQEAADAGSGRLVLEAGVEPHKEIDEIYRRFSKAYDDLDPNAVANLYTESASYLSPGSEIRIGRGHILESFTRSFRSVKERRSSREIRFRIVQRDVQGGLGFDVGLFILTSREADGSTRTSTGKFVTVTKRGEDGVWRFQVDGYSDVSDGQR